MKTTRITLDLTDRQITKLRELMDSVPLSGYADLIGPVLKALPFDHESVARLPSGADADRRDLHAQGPGGGFCLIPFTRKGEAGLRHIEQVLDQIDIGEDWA